MRRTNNQDSYKSVPAATSRLFNDRGHLFVVADGMGAHAAGELASRLAVDTVAQSYLKREKEAPYDAIHAAVLDAHDCIKKRGQDEAAFKGMGTTCISLLILPQGAFIAHVGDSRIYRLRHGLMEQMTFDHSLLWELQRLGKLSAKDTANVPKNVITRSLGPTENLEVDLEGPFPCEIGDTFLMCTDGLSGQVNDDEMAQIIGLLAPEEASNALINLANLRGGPDNTTVTVVKIIGVPDANEKKEGFGVYKKRPPFPISSMIDLPLALASTIIAIFLFFMKINNNILYAGIASVIAAILWGLFFFLARHSLIPEQEDLKIEPMGKGPYVHTKITLSPVFAEAVDKYRHEIEEAVIMKNPAFDRTQIDKFEKKLDLCRGKKDLAGIIGMNLRVINFFFDYLKRSAVS